MVKLKNWQKFLISGILSLILIAGIFLLAGCGEDPKQSDVEAQVSSKYITDSLPTLSYTSQLDIKGKITWDENQTIEKGEHSYTWTFTPDNTDEYTVVTGAVTLKGVDEIYSGETFDSLSVVENNGYYVFLNCNFTRGLTSTAYGTDLTFDGCTFTTSYTGIGGDKCLYLTSFDNLLVQNCTFGGQTSEGEISSAGYALDLNLYNTVVQNISILNNEFKTESADGSDKESVAISIKTRLGISDNPSDLPGDATSGAIEGKVTISGNSFTSTCDNIYIGTDLKGEVDEGITSNYTTGAFTVEVVNNSTNVDVFERYLYGDGVAPAQTVNAGETQTFGNKLAII